MAWEFQETEVQMMCNNDKNREASSAKIHQEVLSFHPLYDIIIREHAEFAHKYLPRLKAE